MLGLNFVRRGWSLAGRTYRETRAIFPPSRPFHSALKRQLKAEKKAKEKETKQAQVAAQQKPTVSTLHHPHT